MGYYSTIEIEGRAKMNKKCVDNLNELSRNNYDALKAAPGNFDYSFENANIVLDNDGFFEELELDEYTSKFEIEPSYLYKLSGCIEDGYLIVKFFGEDGSVTGYFLMPNTVESVCFSIMPHPHYGRIPRSLDLIVGHDVYIEFGKEFGDARTKRVIVMDISDIKRADKIGLFEKAGISNTDILLSGMYEYIFIRDKVEASLGS